MLTVSFLVQFLYMKACGLSMSQITVVFILFNCCDNDGSAFIQRKLLNIRPQISVMVFIQELSLARTRTRSCISLVDTLNSLIVNRCICYAKEQTMIRI